MAELASLIEQDIPDGRQSLQDSHTNLERVAEYCETNYFQSENKRGALEETKNFTTQSLASVAYQINTLAYNFLQMLDLQSTQLEEMESHINHIAQLIMIHKEKVARREIGVLTTNKSTARQHKIIAPANPERPIKYIRKPIDYTILDEIGHGIKTANNTPRSKRISASSGHSQSVSPINGQSGPPPTTKPPTPPQPVRVVGSLPKGSREYRALAPPVPPPQVPSNYAPNYPVGHPRANESRRGERGSAGYGSLPMMMHVGPLQVGMVHPMAQTMQHPAHQVPHSPTPPPPPPESIAAHQHQTSNYGTAALPPPTPPPPPMSAGLPGDYDRSGNISPPLPPPPAEEDHGLFLANYTPPSPPSYPHLQGSEDVPEWVPTHFLEKVVAIYDYMADKDDELSFSENSVIYVVKKNDDGWYEGVMDGVTGLFPGNYVEPCM